MRKPKGTSDIFGEEVYRWQNLENIIRKVCLEFGVYEIRTPMFEFTELFKRGVGETTDIVQKEMFTFKDRGERDYALKPEGTGGVVRAYLENKLSADVQPAKLYYITPCFRDERNQAGRYKQFHQFGVEILGTFDASSDATLISLAHTILTKYGIKDIQLKINSLGDNKCRENYNNILKKFIETKIDNLCDDCKNRYEKNPLRTLDCKNEICRKNLEDAPTTIENLDDECTKHFESLKKYLDIMKISYEIDTNIVRGLDYYTKTVFEFVCKSKKLGSQTTICGGGRYDNLIEELGGKRTGAIGFGMGLERLLILESEQNEITDFKKNEIVYVGAIGELGSLKAMEIAYNLRKKEIPTECDIVKRSVKAQLKYADKIGAKYVVIIGESELENNIVNLKNMNESKEIQIKLSNIEEEIYKIYEDKRRI